MVVFCCLCRKDACWRYISKMHAASSSKRSPVQKIASLLPFFAHVMFF